MVVVGWCRGDKRSERGLEASCRSATAPAGDAERIGDRRRDRGCRCRVGRGPTDRRSSSDARTDGVETPLGPRRMPALLAADVRRWRRLTVRDHRRPPDVQRRRTLPLSVVVHADGRPVECDDAGVWRSVARQMRTRDRRSTDSRGGSPAAPTKNVSVFRHDVDEDEVVPCRVRRRHRHGDHRCHRFRR